jgi:geranylgeranyl diphosphate synthase type II
MTKTTETAPPAGLAEYLADARRKVDEALGHYLPAIDPSGRSDTPARLAEAMRYSVLGGGKRLRPVLALMAAEACGSDPDAALPSACALEMVHTYSLIHDDLPAMDDDDLRRGRPTCHKAFDEATAILAGDALLTLAFEVVARHTRPAEAVAGCVLALAEGSGPDGMVGGQMADLQAETRADGDAAELEAIHRRKTGALLRAALMMGAAVAGAPAEEAEALDRYGRAIGLAFQIIDDLLDVQGDEAKLGKRVNKDSEQGKWTYPRFLGIEGSRRKARLLAEEAVEALRPLGDRGLRLRELAWDLLERDR